MGYNIRLLLIPVNRELLSSWPATGEWWLPWGALRGQYSCPLNPMVWTRDVTAEQGICSYWDRKSIPVCRYPLCTVDAQVSGAGMWQWIFWALALAMEPCVMNLAGVVFV